MYAFDIHKYLAVIDFQNGLANFHHDLFIYSYIYTYILVSTARDALQILRDGVPTQKYPVRILSH